MRFICTCRADYTGRWYEKNFPSCKDLATNGAKISGMHFLYDSQKNLFPVYCDFDSEAGYVWALVQSFALANNDQFKHSRFGVDHPVNEDGGKVSWNSYRLSLSRKQSIADASTHLRATCNFPDDGLVYTDYARAKLESHNLFGYWIEECRTYEYLKIRGIDCQGCIAGTWQRKAWHINSYLSSTNAGCQFHGSNGVYWEQKFGLYNLLYVNSAFRCTASLNSTTQQWIGSTLPYGRSR